FFLPASVSTTSDFSILFTHTSLFSIDDTASTEIYTLSLHDALPISRACTIEIKAFSPPLNAPLFFIRKAQCNSSDSAILCASVYSIARIIRSQTDSRPAIIEQKIYSALINAFDFLVRWAVFQFPRYAAGISTHHDCLTIVGLLVDYSRGR